MRSYQDPDYAEKVPSNSYQDPQHAEKAPSDSYQDPELDIARSAERWSEWLTALTMKPPPPWREMLDAPVRVAVVGRGRLAQATREACRRYHIIVDTPFAEVAWFCETTPVDDQHRPQTDVIREELRNVLLSLDPDVPVLISSPVPVGFCRSMEKKFPLHHLASQPENVRTATALVDFLNQERMIVGTRYGASDSELIGRLLRPFTSFVQFMSPESAEMVKHTLNTFLAMEIAFANEISDFCERVGANPVDVFSGFRSDRRVGSGPLVPGGPARGSLPRDVRVLNDMDPGPLIRAIQESNEL